PLGGMMLPALRSKKRSPGSVDVIKFGLMRESEQVMNRASGDCCFRASCSKFSRWSGKWVVWNLRTPAMILCMISQLLYGRPDEGTRAGQRRPAPTDWQGVAGRMSERVDEAAGTVIHG